MRFPRRHPVRLLLLLGLCCLLTACDLDETVAVNSDGSGTYVARLSVEKQFADSIAGIKAQAQQRGYKVEDSETPDRKILTMRRDFANVSELNDSNDTYTLQLESRAGLQKSYTLSLRINTSAWVNPIQKRMIHFTLPVPVISATNGTFSGRHVDWDCTNGGSLVIQAAGVPLPFGLTPLLLAFLLVAVGIAAVAAVRARKKRASPATVCANCATPLGASAQFCPACGTRAAAPA